MASSRQMMNQRLSSLGNLFFLLPELAYVIGAFSANILRICGVLLASLFFFIHLICLNSPFSFFPPFFQDFFVSYLRDRTSIFLKGTFMVSYSVEESCFAWQCYDPSYFLILYFYMILAHAAEIPGFSLFPDFSVIPVLLFSLTMKAKALAIFSCSFLLEVSGLGGAKLGSMRVSALQTVPTKREIFNGRIYQSATILTA